jgi:hypothetical protein
MSRRFSQSEIREVVTEMENETPKALTPEETLAAHQEVLRPKRQPIQNDFMSKPNRWNGVQGGPQGLKKSS